MSIDAGVDTDFFTVVFRDATPVQISVDVLSGTDFQPLWRLLDASGDPAESCGGFQSGSGTCGPLVDGGPFRLEVIDDGLNGTGAYALAIDCDPTDVSEPHTPAPIAKFMVHPNRPNPCNPWTAFAFDLPSEGRAVGEVLSLDGRRVAVFLDRFLPGGRHEVAWNAGSLPSGLYIYRLRWNGMEKAGKFTVLK